MQIKPSIKTAQPNQQVLVVCPYTGIASALTLCEIPGKVLEAKHPLAEFAVAKEIVKEGVAYLRKLEPSILSGLMLSIYKHYGLIHFGRESAIEQNTLLQSAGTECLIRALSLSRAFTVKNLEYIPEFSLDWSTHASAYSLAESLFSYIRLIQDSIFPPAQTKAEIDTTSIKLKKLVSTKKPASNFDAEFKAAKVEAKVLIQASLLEQKFKGFLIQLFSGKNLLMINDELRAKVVARLEANNEARLAEIVRDMVDPFINVEAFDDAFDRASDSFTPRPKRSLADILAAKQAKAQPKQLVEEAEESQSEEDDFGLAEESSFIDPTEDSIIEEELNHDDF